MRRPLGMPGKVVFVIVIEKNMDEKDVQDLRMDHGSGMRN